MFKKGIEFFKRSVLFVSVLLFTISAAYALLIYTIASYYTWPNIETIGLCGLSRDLGILNGAVDMLNWHDGRYTTNIMHGINPLAFNWFMGIKLMPMIFWGLQWTAFLLWIHILYSNSIFHYKKVAVSFIITAAHFAVSPHLKNEVFNISASFVYGYGFIFWLFTSAFFILYLKNYNNPKGVWYSILAMFFCVACVGSNSMYLFANYFVIVVLLYFFINSKNITLIKASVPYIITLLASSIFFLTSPGIEERAGAFESKHHFEHLDDLPGNVFNHIVYYFETYYFQNAFLILAGLALLTILNVRAEAAAFIEKHGKTLIMLAFLLFVGGFFLTIPYYVFMGHKIVFPKRIFIPVSNFIQLGVWSVLLYLQHLYVNELKRKKIVLVFTCSTWFFLSIFLMENNFSKIYKEYESGKLEAFDINYRKRFFELTQKTDVKNWDVVFIDTLINEKNMIFYDTDIQPNRLTPHWNNSLALYFKRDEVRVKGDTVKITDVVVSKLK